MHRFGTLSFGALLLAMVPIEATGQEKPVTDQDPSALDVAATPLSDLNLKKDEIPQLLVDATSRPYELSGLNSCVELIEEINKFNIMLGDDFDLPQDESGGLSAGAIGQRAVGSFIPFRGLVRQSSGASERQQKLAVAIQAGFARRGFLKSTGLSRECDYPARPATADDISKLEKAREEQAEKGNRD